MTSQSLKGFSYFTVMFFCDFFMQNCVSLNFPRNFCQSCRIPVACRGLQMRVISLYLLFPVWGQFPQFLLFFNQISQNKIKTCSSNSESPWPPEHELGVDFCMWWTTSGKLPFLKIVFFQNLLKCKMNIYLKALVSWARIWCWFLHVTNHEQFSRNLNCFL